MNKPERTPAKYSLECLRKAATGRLDRIGSKSHSRHQPGRGYGSPVGDSKRHVQYTTGRPLKFVKSVTSNIIGSTSVDQLKENIDSIHVDISKELMAKINAIQDRIPDPAP